MTDAASIAPVRPPRIMPNRHIPHAVQGHYRRIKTVIASILLTLFFVMPWLRWSRGDLLPNQAILFDLPGRRLFVFGFEFWPQDLPLAAGILMFSAFALFYATTLAGRVWCGFACPQTVWTDFFFAIDRWSARFAGQNSLQANVLRKGSWIAIAILTGFTFTAYFADAPTFTSQIVRGTGSPAAYSSLILIAGMTWLLAAYARERVCLHMCPWPRFQAALLDIESLVVTYRSWRGEPRAKKRVPLRSDLVVGTELHEYATDEGRGDCIDCQRCVNVCPTGIDIRDGLQMGCIGCGLCIDACDDIMHRLDRPAGLICFDTESASGVHSFTRAKVSLLRLKALLFAIACIFAIGAVGAGLARMSDVTLDVDSERNPPFVRLSDGSIRNDYVLRLSHRRPHLANVKISIEGLAHAQLRAATSQKPATGSSINLPVDADRSASDRLLVSLPKDDAPAGRVPFTFVFADAATGQNLGKIESYFWGPSK